MIFEAMSREEAVKNALAHFSCRSECLRVTEMEKPHKKMLGFMKKPGRYDIQVMEEEKEEKKEKKESEHQNGTIEILSGRVTIGNPKGRGVPASVFVKHPQMTLMVNGEAVSGTRNLTEEDVLEFLLEDIQPERHVTVEFSEDLLHAYLKVERIKGKHFILKDLDKASKAVLELVEEDMETEALEEKDCLKILEDFGVQKEFISMDEIRKACGSKDSIKVRAATGKAPVASRKADISYCPEIFVKEILRGLEPVITQGTILAEKLAPAVPGVPGMDVKGNDITVKKVKDEDLEATDGAEIRGNRIVAQRDGRPYLKKGKIGVVPLLTMVGDLDKDTENISFDGDVVIKGNVQDNMIIKATGNISVIGSVYHSEILSDQNVEIQGKIIGGRVQAGDANSVFQLLLPVIEEMILQIEEIFKGLHMTEGREVSDLIKTINIGKEKLETSMGEVDKITSLLNEAQQDTVMKLKKSMNYAFKEIRLLRKEGFIELNDIYEKLQGYRDMMKEELLDERVVKVTYAQNASISSSGDILITGEGSYQAKLSAGHEIRFEKPGNVVKGGTLMAGKNIRAGIIGTPSEIETFCKVMDPQGEITGRFYKGTTLVIRDRLKEYIAIE